MQSSEERPIAPGDRVDGYVLGSEIGKGATAWVFEATHEESGDLVAIKVMRPGVREDSSLRVRFDRELGALAGIDSIHVPQLYGTGELESGLPYVVMERLRGGTLHDRLCEDEQLTTTLAIELAMQLAAALSAAHAAGVVHRDVKPSNLVLHEGPDDVLILKLLDFGICIPIGEDEPKLTLPGKTVGTPDYMSPEQARGLPLDGRSDVFSAGSVIYEMLTGRSPFGGRSAKAIARAVTRKEPRPLNELRPDCPDEVVALVARAMAKERDDRIASAEALREALAAVSEELERRVPARGATLAMSAMAPERPRLELHPELDDDGASRETDIIDLPRRPGWQRAAAIAIVVLGMAWGALHVSGQGEALYDLASGEATGVPVNAVAVAEASDDERREPRKEVSVDPLDAIARAASEPLTMPDVAPSPPAARAEGEDAEDAEESEDADAEDARDDARASRRARARRDSPPSTTVLVGSSAPAASPSADPAADVDRAARQIRFPALESSPLMEPAWTGGDEEEPRDVATPGNPY